MRVSGSIQYRASGPTARQRRIESARAFVVKFTPQLLLLLLLAVMAIINPRSVSPGNLIDVFINAVPVALLALGAMWILVSGGLDLSAGFGVAMCALVVGGGLQQGLPLPMVLINGIGAGLALGLVNGVLIGVLSIPPFIATLATMVGVQGVVLLLGQQGTVIVNDDFFSFIADARPLGIPMLIVIAVFIATVVATIARYTVFGLYTYGLGSNSSAMESRGVPVIRQIVLVYVFGGLMVALTAIVLVAKVQIVDTNIANINILLDAFAATILGGTSLFGGKGTVSGTLTGALIISLISTSLLVVGVSAENINLFKGITIVVAVIIDAGIRSLENRHAGRSLQAI